MTSRQNETGISSLPQESLQRRIFVAATFVLVIGIIHTAYTFYIRPYGENAVELARLAGLSAPRHPLVILKDWEQEICIILMIFCFLLIFSRLRELKREDHIFTVELFADGDTPRQLLDTIETKLNPEYRQSHLIRTLEASLRRYAITEDVQNTADTVESNVDALGLELESNNAMIRYMIWAIPSIGFVGTVRGIGQALSEADKALAGDIAGMTASLGTAFNSTLVALLVSLPLMFMLHRLQRAQDRRLVEIQRYCEDHLLRHISKTHAS